MSPLTNDSILNVSQATSPNPACQGQFGALHYIIAAFIIIFGLTANGFICVAFAIKRKLRTVTNYFVVNLAVADFLLIFCWIVWMILYFICADLKVPIATMLEVLFATASVVGLAMVSFDRYYAVTRALHYNSTMTHSRALISIICIWVYAGATSLLYLGLLYTDVQAKQLTYVKYYVLMLLVINFLLPFCVAMFCYVSIFSIALSHLRHSAPAGQPTDPNSNAAIILRQLKITFNIVILAAPFLLIWNFYYGIQVYESFNDWEMVTSSVLGEFFVSNLPQLVATINPLVFICLTKDLRRFARSGCQCLVIRRRGHDRVTLTETYPNSTQYTSGYPSNGDFASTKV
ncbi:predicted protein [Nematostella vectensis]|uniref:G-protein coupled receptors family 1 profile domain-containing protein n=1 Tax=Nematostella vectensis TaxID=45351 RepID=A7RYX0_NEMVE|nr:alpha-1A adrenergic receptor isoform X3 [Nematostella vectensis]EDO43301.1 predicted protein [Nematostella vectensis]|eukprot:XP_001635364.1 predicted protein [Nematostella vectensis]